MVGINFFCIWNNEGSAYIKKNVNIKTSNKFEIITTTGTCFITGGGSGELTIWEGLDAKVSKNVHKKQIDTIRTIENKYNVI